MTLQALPYILLAGLLAGSSLIASRFGVGQFQPITYIGLRMVLASLGHLSFYFLDHQRHKWPTNPQLWGHAALLGVGTVAAMTVYIIPVVSGLGGALILDEYVTRGMIAGMGLIAAGIACLNQQRKRVTLTPGRPMTDVVGGRGPTPSEE